MTRLRFFHIHIPKSAGSMIDRIIAANFGSRAVREHVLASYIKYDLSNVAEILKLYPYDCFSGHIYSLKSIPFDSDDRLRAFSFVRAPMEKAKSAYFYLRTRAESCETHPAKLLSPYEYFRQPLSGQRRDSFWVDSSQVDWLVGVDNASVCQVIPHLEKAHLHLFPTERFDESCILMEKLWPQYFTDCSYRSRVNASTRDRQITAADMTAIEALPFFRRDAELHKLANDHLDTLLAKHIGGSVELASALDEFKDRCRNPKRSGARHRNNAFIPRLKRRVQRLIGRVPL